MGERADVVVIGAGLAGLVCTRTLQRRGFDVLLLEAADRPGGRVRTDVVDGFRCDRGFQLLNPAYPAVRRQVDVEALHLRTFGRGVEVLREDGLRVLADPLRHPGQLSSTLRSGYLRPREAARLARWVAPALGSVRRLLAAPDRSLADSWAAAGVRGPLRDEVLAPFLAGVLAEDTAATSAAYVRLVLRSFARATPGVPALGMQALADQLAVLPGRPVRFDSPVHEVRRTAGGPWVLTADGEIGARAVVVATDAPGAGALLDLEVPAMRGLRTYWFATDEAPSDLPFLRVDGRRRGPVLNTAVMTVVAPSYAPPGRHLVEATTLLPSNAAEADVRRQLSQLWSCDTSRWALVVRHDVPHALPSLPPPLDVRRQVDLGDGVFVAGDHRDTPSLQGALVSGARTAHAVGAHLAGPSRGAPRPGAR